MHSDEGVHEHAVGMRARDRGHTMRELALWCETEGAVVCLAMPHMCECGVLACGYAGVNAVRGILGTVGSWEPCVWVDPGAARHTWLIRQGMCSLGAAGAGALSCGPAGLRLKCAAIAYSIRCEDVVVQAWRCRRAGMGLWGNRHGAPGGVKLRAYKPATQVCRHGASGVGMKCVQAWRCWHARDGHNAPKHFSGPDEGRTCRNQSGYTVTHSVVCKCLFESQSVKR
eukprot:1184108-Prorocentrum_minimum.AAC.2